MNNQTPQERRSWKDTALKLLRRITHNGGFKLLALLLSVALWAGLITQDPSLTRERHFQNVTVSISGSDAVKRNGFIVTSDLKSLLTDVDLEVDVPQMQYQNVTASNYNVRVDLSRITGEGTQTLKILTSSSSTYGTVKSVVPSTIEIEVEPYITRYRIPVRVATTGEPPEGFYASTPAIDPPMVAVSGPRSLVYSINSAEAVVELDKLPAREGEVLQAVPFTLLDRNGTPVQSDLLEITSESVLVDSVLVEQDMFTKREIALSDLGIIRGTPAAGYEVKSVTITPARVAVAGKASELEELNLLYANSYLDVSGLKETVNSNLRIRQPAELTYMSATTCTVVAEIGPIMSERVFSKIRLGIENVERNHVASLGTKEATVTVTAPQLWVNNVVKGDVQLYCDATGLGAGTYDLPVLCTISGSGETTYDLEIVPATVHVTIEEK